MITSIASEVLGKYHTISLLKHWVHWEEMETSGVGARRRLSRSPELLSSHQIQPNQWRNSSAQTKVTKGVCYGLNPKSPFVRIQVAPSTTLDTFRPLRHWGRLRELATVSTAAYPSSTVPHSHGLFSYYTTPHWNEKWPPLSLPSFCVWRAVLRSWIPACHPRNRHQIIS